MNEPLVIVEDECGDYSIVVRDAGDNLVLSTNDSAECLANVALSEESLLRLVDSIDSWLIKRRVWRMSSEELDAELRAAGVDPNKSWDRVKALIESYKEADR